MGSRKEITEKETKANSKEKPKEKSKKEEIKNEIVVLVGSKAKGAGGWGSRWSSGAGGTICGCGGCVGSIGFDEEFVTGFAGRCENLAGEAALDEEWSHGGGDL
jgi:hypothetical protein